MALKVPCSETLRPVSLRFQPQFLGTPSSDFSPFFCVHLRFLSCAIFTWSIFKLFEKPLFFCPNFLCQIPFKCDVWRQRLFLKKNPILFFHCGRSPPQSPPSQRHFHQARPFFFDVPPFLFSFMGDRVADSPPVFF